MTRYLVVGNGIAGVTAAQAIAQAEPGADLHVYAAEGHPYYRRPQLPAYIAGEATERDITHRPPQWYKEQGIRVHLSCPVAELEPSAGRVRLEDGRTAAYDRLLLATGGRSWLVPVEGITLRGLFALRTLDDARAICAHADTARQAVVIGGGLLGLETARALRARGLAVTVLELSEHLMPRQVDREGAVVLQGIVESLGIRVLTQAATEAIVGRQAVEGVQVKNGPELPTDLVICAAGWRCQVGLAQQAGLAVNRGIVADAHLQTSAEAIYAAGDVAEVEGQLYGIVPAAVEQARVAAANMVAAGSARYTGTIPSTTLKVAGAELTTLGQAVVEEQGLLQLRHVDLEARHYRKFVVQDGQIVGAIMLNERARSLVVRRLIQQRVDVSRHTARLLDDEFDLKSLLESD
ncbi:MAG: NAD(P)/FAD-dependent oxidoreductase [Anaerolineae bacterium]|nr:NAD(P)/FAD-dependent oxidoreductase [Anaerolineae bacterium]